MVGIVHREAIIQILKKCSLLDTIMIQDNRQHIYKKVNNFLVVELSVCVVALLLAYGYHVSSWANGISIVPFCIRFSAFYRHSCSYSVCRYCFTALESFQE
jgi:hypothetical protein